MSLLTAHLEQIAVSCEGIDNLPFPPPRIFTNALLSNHDITYLIRDTEAHERALFSVPATPTAATSQNPGPPKSSARRQTVFNVSAGEVTTGPSQSTTRSAPRRNTAVAAVLGGDLHARIFRTGSDAKGDVDIEVLLHGAEKLCGVYPLQSAIDRIPAQRQRHAQQNNTLAYYESKVAEQQAALESMNKDLWLDDDATQKLQMTDFNDHGIETWTREDLRREEDEVRELERKKKELQDTLRAMEKDIGGLLDL